MERLVLTVKEAAVALNMCVAMVYKLMNREEHPIPSMKIADDRTTKIGKQKRLISVDALKAWIAEETEMTMKGRN